MPRLRFQRAALEKRDALLDAATREFATYGYEDASINRILLAAGFSKGSFYYYFDDKPDLAVAVLERWAAQFENVWDDFPQPTTPEEFWAAGEALMNRGSAQIHDMPTVSTDAIMRLGTALARHADVRERLATTVVPKMMSKIVEVWKRGQEIGAVRTDMPVTDILTLAQEAKLTLVRLRLPTDRPATAQEIDDFARLHFDLVRRISEP